MSSHGWGIVLAVLWADLGCAQQVGECDIVLEYGSKALEKWEARSMRRDILFAMALAHLGLASDALEAKEKVSSTILMHTLCQSTHSRVPGTPIVLCLL